MSKVKKITISNLKAVSNQTATFNGCSAILTAGNNKGKTTFLRGLFDRLRGNKNEDIIKHGEKEGFAEAELTTGEKIKWEFTNSKGFKEKLTYTSEKNIKQSVTKELMNFLTPPLFDVDEFLQAAPAKQKTILQKLTGIDFTEIDRVFEAAYEERTFANRKLAEEKAKFTGIDPDLPETESSVIELEKGLAGIDAHNMQYKNFQVRLREKKDQCNKNDGEIIRLRNLITDLENENIQLNIQINAGDKWINDEKNQPKNNAEILKQQIEDTRKKNEAIRLNNLAKEQRKELEKAETNAVLADADVKRIEAEKLDVIKNASMPEGFGFDDEGITYNGFAFNKQSLSSSGIYIAALKLAALQLGDIKTLHFDASFLDKNSLAEIEAWANENDLQLLIERPAFDGSEISYEIIQNS